MKTDKNSIMLILKQGANDYHKFFENKNFLFLCREVDHISFKEVLFTDANYLHLTGVKTNMKAKLFYSVCLDGKLSQNDFDLKKDGNTARKLKVLPHIEKIINSSTLIGDYNNNGFALNTDYLVGDTKKILSMGFSFDVTLENKFIDKIDFPNTLLAEDIKQVTTKSNQILAVIYKFKEQLQYSTVTFLAKGIELKSLRIPKEILGKINPSLLI